MEQLDDAVAHGALVITQTDLRMGLRKDDPLAVTILEALRTRHSIGRDLHQYNDNMYLVRGEDRIPFPTPILKQFPDIYHEEYGYSSQRVRDADSTSYDPRPFLRYKATSLSRPVSIFPSDQLMTRIPTKKQEGYSPAAWGTPRRAVIPWRSLKSASRTFHRWSSSESSTQRPASKSYFYNDIAKPGFGFEVQFDRKDWDLRPVRCVSLREINQAQVHGGIIYKLSKLAAARTHDDLIKAINEHLFKPFLIKISREPFDIVTLRRTRRYARSYRAQAAFHWANDTDSDADDSHKRDGHANDKATKGSGTAAEPYGVEDDDWEVDHDELDAEPEESARSVSLGDHDSDTDESDFVATPTSKETHPEASNFITRIRWRANYESMQPTNRRTRENGRRIPTTQSVNLLRGHPRKRAAVPIACNSNHECTRSAIN